MNSQKSCRYVNTRAGHVAGRPRRSAARRPPPEARRSCVTFAWWRIWRRQAKELKLEGK
jgi:hypothetical protein